MATPTLFKDTDELFAAVLTYYRAHTQQVSGPTEATRQCWPSLRGRIPMAMLEALARDQVVDEVRRLATTGTVLGSGAQPENRTITIYYRRPDTPNEAPKPVKITVQRVPDLGPRKLYPRILLDTTFNTATVAKPLLRFTAADFDYCIAGYADQQKGIARHIGAMEEGKRLLATHQVATVDALPEKDLTQFAACWQEAVRRSGGGAPVPTS